MIEILTVELNDAETISEIIDSFSHEFLSSSKAHAASFFELTSPKMEREYICSPRYIFAKASYQDTLIAFTAVRDTSHLFHLFVRKDYQGQGLGRNLWLHVKELSFKAGNKGWFTVNAAIKSVSFYEKLGFIVESDTIEEDGVLFIQMRLKSLTL
ncbi:MAG: GNAT family N-acetyltransferase [Dechloromonas sp.]|uniref:GNAT family N-acetyltransferase n=1 Tax=Dechloromonas sp. TaxID=1917218 RepID=UPI0027E9EC29|nr:GNAT family N-acetyltransferase [Dechloromonas sp.]MBT9521866.1 GNAT family N-acetyltransferase [Dechloromonas sp.]